MTASHGGCAEEMGRQPNASSIAEVPIAADLPNLLLQFTIAMPPLA
jgi:hypothetical protein